MQHEAPGRTGRARLFQDCTHLQDACCCDDCQPSGWWLVMPPLLLLLLDPQELC